MKLCLSTAIAAVLLCSACFTTAWAAENPTNCERDRDQKGEWGAYYQGTGCLISAGTTDVHRFRFQGRANQQAMFSLSANGSKPAESFCLRIFDPTGRPTSVGRFCHSYRVKHKETFQQTGTYIVEIFPARTLDDRSMMFDFSAIRFAPSVPSPVVPDLYSGETHIGRIEGRAEMDSFAIPGIGGASIKIKVDKFQDSGYNRCFQLYDPSGNVTPSASRVCGAGTVLQETLPEDGIYTLLIVADSRNQTDYTISLSCISGTCPARPDPVAVDLNINGHDDMAIIHRSQPMQVSLFIAPNKDEGEQVELWVGAYTGFGTYWYTGRGWVPERDNTPQPSSVSRLTAINVELLNMSLPAGAYYFFALADRRINGRMDVAATPIEDSVGVLVTDN